MLVLGLTLCCTACTTPEARTCTGQPLQRPTLAPEKQAKLEANLEAARVEARTAPTSEDAAIWVGRRLAYLGRYQEAIAWYTISLEQFGSTPKLLRHRGHRFITVREFERAIADLSHAWEHSIPREDEIEPDGIPTAAGPRSTLKGNIAYHRALAEFCLGDLESARLHWQDAIDLATNDDSLVAACYWLAVTEFERGNSDGARAVLARITQGMDVQENQSYLRLTQLLKGALALHALAPTQSAIGIDVDRATLVFGKAMHARHVLHDEAGAKAILESAASLPEWAAFGVIACESVLARTP
ncbi:MAG: tetratricopeptide repeat protein [Phycisphaerales bacterium]|nr:tetratricopeptide repeat protein [Phycisphaerales bacterium]